MRGRGVTYKAARTLPFDISPVVERTITGFVFTYKMGRARLVKSPDPLVFMVRRSEFDHLLAMKAVEAGAELHDATEVRDFTVQDDRVSVATSSGGYEADFLIGADGALGVTARAAVLMADRVLLPAIEH